MSLKSRTKSIGQIVVCGSLLCVAPVARGGDSWSATATQGAPSGRELHTAVWAGSKMIVWGGTPGFTINILARTETGESGPFNTGGLYDPVSNTWSATSTNSAPVGRYDHTAVWTGTKMIVWGGVTGTSAVNDGGAYDPESNSWAAISTMNAPTPRYLHTAIWTGSKMIVWGGWTRVQGAAPGIQPEGSPAGAGAVRTGGIYDPVANSWTPISTFNAPSPRGEHVAVWTGSKMIVWGGDDGTSNDLNDGGIYDPATDSWTPTSLTHAPSARDYHAAVWTGSRLIVWGGYGNATAETNTGGVFDPDSNTWTPTSLSNAPQGRSWPTAVWTGAKMIIWGGYAEPEPPPQAVYFSNGGLYDPVVNGWSPMTTTGAPSGRSNHTSVWTGSEMITWGGFDGNSVVNSGGVYTPPAPPCPAEGGRECVAPIAPGFDTDSSGRNRPI